MSQAEDTTNAAQNISDMSDELGRIKSNVNDLHSIANSMNSAKNKIPEAQYILIVEGQSSKDYYKRNYLFCLY